MKSALLVLLDMTTHPNPFPKRVCVYVHICTHLLSFPQVIFSRMSMSNNKGRDYFDRNTRML